MRLKLGRSNTNHGRQAAALSGGRQRKHVEKSEQEYREGARGR